MRLVLLGATGGIGRHLVSGALFRGHSVTAFVRSPSKIELTHPKLKVRAGDVFDERSLAAAFEGHDAVLSSFGPNAMGPSTLRRDFGRAVVNAMKLSGVRRVLVVSSAFLFSHAGAAVYLLSHTLFRFVARDMAAMEREFASTGLDWTIVRPPRLTNGGATQNYRICDDELPRSGLLISREDVADFMMNEVERKAHLQKVVGVAN